MLTTGGGYSCIIIIGNCGDFYMKKKNVYLIVGIVSLICVITGVSFAAWILNFQQTNSNIVATDCFSITFKEDTEAIQLLKAYPITDEEGKTLTPYTFTITNQCSSYASYQIKLEVINDSTLTNYSYLKVMLGDNTPVLLSSNEVVQPTLDNATTSFKLTTGYLDHNESVTYNLRLWMDENVTANDTDSMNKVFNSKATIIASYIDHMPTAYEQCIEEYGEDSIQCSILADVDTEGCPTVNADGTVQVTGREDTTGYLCSAPDDYGSSYYYRGNVENNWVKFGGYYWRILRINGDGSIRMIYAGDASVIDALPNKSDVLKNGYNDSSTDYTQIGESYYNFSYNNNAHVGYMYGENIWGEPEMSETTSSRTLNNYYYYADSYTFDTTTGTYTLTNPTQAVWSEELVGKYTCLSTSTSCTILYAIDSYYDSYRAYVYRYTRTRTDAGYEENHETSRSTRELARNYSYGTGYTFDKTTGEFRLTDYTSSVYDGSQVGKYTCASTSYSECTTLYYIESEDTIITANAYTISRTWDDITYDDTHVNIANSTIKGKVDAWYEEHIQGTEYERYIADTLFCNDRSFGSSNSGTGTGTSETRYRWFSSSNGIRLTCPNQNDRFTVDDEVTGNGDLTYPIGLVNTDEVYLAGGYTATNSGYYLYTGNYYWTMSPNDFDDGYAYVRGVHSNGYASIYSNYVNDSHGVRPVINLKADSLKSGDGTASNPYTVEVMEA